MAWFCGRQSLWNWFKYKFCSTNAHYWDRQSTALGVIDRLWPFLMKVLNAMKARNVNVVKILKCGATMLALYRVSKHEVRFYLIYLKVKKKIKILLLY